ncbi:MAG TPA: KTSC domain-containing protein [Candidatus Kapabacteria bacterium]|nr:KTSC domain-containing protein [Candidatus Kapabacteria bacterium]
MSQSLTKEYPSDHNVRRVTFLPPLTLEVEYTGGTYQYKNVAEEVYHQAIEAESIGKFLTAEVKKKYQYVRVK